MASSCVVYLDLIPLFEPYNKNDILICPKNDESCHLVTNKVDLPPMTPDVSCNQPVEPNFQPIEV